MDEWTNEWMNESIKGRKILLFNMYDVSKKNKFHLPKVKNVIFPFILKYEPIKSIITFMS